MQNSNALSTDILDCLPDAVFTVNHNRQITFLNKRSEQIFGVRRDVLIGKPCSDLCARELCQVRCPVARTLKSRLSLRNTDFWARDKDGSAIQVIVNTALVRRAGTAPSVVVTVKDVLTGKRSISQQAEFFGMVGESKAMADIFHLVQEISTSDVSVLLQGETGTGKEMIADAIQAISLRHDRPYVKVNCSVLPPQLLASELFGHAKGAFTDAIHDRCGRFQLADKGTLFLDEISEMSLQMQAQLLRVLQHGTFERVGESTTRTADVRIISATNVSLAEAVDAGRFRKDLMYRLNVIPIDVPPLRHRAEDIHALAYHFMDKFSKQYRKKINHIEARALELLQTYKWPGNIRELENAIEYAFVRSKRDMICVCCLPPYLRETVDCSKFKSENDKLELISLLTQHNWNKSEVAKILGVDRSTVWRRLKKLGIKN